MPPGVSHCLPARHDAYMFVLPPVCAFVRALVCPPDRLRPSLPSFRSPPLLHQHLSSPIFITCSLPSHPVGQHLSALGLTRARRQLSSPAWKYSSLLSHLYLLGISPSVETEEAISKALISDVVPMLPRHFACAFSTAGIEKSYPKDPSILTYWKLVSEFETPKQVDCN